MINKSLSKKIKQLENNEFNHFIFIIILIITVIGLSYVIYQKSYFIQQKKKKILFHVDTISKLIFLYASHAGMCLCLGSVQEMEFILQFKP
jgi:hypothetical protein